MTEENNNEEKNRKNWLSWIGLDKEGLDRLGIKEDLTVFEKFLFAIGLLLFWPVLLFVRKRNNYKNELNPTKIIIWFVVIILSFIVVYINEYHVQNYFLYAEKQFSYLEIFIYKLHQFLRTGMGLFIFVYGAGMISWFIIDPWQEQLNTDENN